MSAKITMLAIWTLPAIRISDPNSPTARANASAVPDRIAGHSDGSTMRRNVTELDAPSDAAASSTSRSSSTRTGCTARTTNGSVTNSSANKTAPRVNTRCSPNGLSGPYSAIRVSPATIVGSANGRSISEPMNRLPGNSSRTNTQATTVPITAPIAATSSDAPSVTASAVSDVLLVIDCQNSLGLWENALTTTAASGISTMMLM